MESLFLYFVNCRAYDWIAVYVLGFSDAVPFDVERWQLLSFM